MPISLQVVLTDINLLFQLLLLLPHNLLVVVQSTGKHVLMRLMISHSNGVRSSVKKQLMLQVGHLKMIVAYLPDKGLCLFGELLYDSLGLLGLGVQGIYLLEVVLDVEVLFLQCLLYLLV